MTEEESFEQNRIGNVSFFTFETEGFNDSTERDDVLVLSRALLWFQASYDATTEERSS